MNQNAALGQAKAARTEFGDFSNSNRNISPGVLNAQAPDMIEVFRERCEARALLFVNGQMSLHDAVDELQASAERCGLIDRIGQDQLQAIMGTAFAAVRFEPGPPSLTPKSVIDAFWALVRSNDPARLKSWLCQHHADAPNLLKLLEGNL